MFGLYADDIELKNKAKKINLSDYEAVCFDEIAKHSPDRLKRIAQFIVNNPDKYIFGAGVLCGLRPTKSLVWPCTRQALRRWR